MSPPARSWIRILALGSALLGAISGARAQGLATANEGLTVGRFLLHPSVTFEFGRNNNLFRQSKDLAGRESVDSGVFLARARLVVELPLGESRVRWAYSPVYRDYSSQEFRQSNRFSHYLDLDGDFRVGPALRLAVRDRLVRGTVELQEVDPGGELTFGLVPFTTHEPELELALDIAGRYGVSLTPRYSSVSFERHADAPLFDSRRRGLEGRLNYRISEPTTLYAFYAHDSTDLEGLTATRSGSRSVGLGLRRTVNQAIVTSLSAGYASLEFDQGPATRFRGPILDAAAHWRIGDVTSLQFVVGRLPYQSFTVDSNYYVNSHARLGFTQQIGRSVYWEAGLTFNGNVYADPEDPGAQRRRDRTGSLEFGAGYQFLRTLRAYVGYTLERRRSNIEGGSPGMVTHPLDFDSSQLFLRIEAGWR